MQRTNARVALALPLLLVAGAWGCGDSGGGDGNGNLNQNNQATTLCGDGLTAGSEECDNGEANSDTLPDACRTDCRLPRCGDRVVDEGEQCDDGPGNADGVSDACRSGCVAPRCGDGVVDVLAGEQCDCGDGTGAPPAQCDGQSNSDAPDAFCRTDCRVRSCGDGILDPSAGEACEPGLPLEESCVSLGFYDGGTLACADSCRYDTSQCAGSCGDGLISGAEACDGTNLGGARCDTVGYWEGSLSCTPICTFDVSQCARYCGDGTLDPEEVCDTVATPGRTCRDYGFDRGWLGCTDVCTPEFGGCATVGWRSLVPPASITVYTLFGLDERRVWAAGNSNSAFFYNGASWVAEPLPAGINTLFGIWGTAPENLFAVGANGTILRRGAGGWASMASPTTEHLRAIWGSGPTDVWAVGEHLTILRYDGTSWALVSGDTGTGATLEGVWGSGPTDVFVAGAGISHFDGAAFTSMSYPVAGIAPRRLWGSGPNDVYALGYGGLLHYDGLAWSVALPNGSLDPQDGYDIHGTGRRDVYIVGGSGRVLHFDGQTWVPQLTPTAERLNAVFAASPRAVFAGGWSSTIVRSWGSSWGVAEAGTTRAVTGAWMASNGEVFAPLGWTTGEVLHFDTYQWTVVPMPTSGSLDAVWGTSATDVYVVGGSRIFHYDGATWSQMTATVPSSLSGIWGSGPRDLWAVGGSPAGDQGFALHFDGTAWTQIAIPVTSRMHAVWGSGPDDVWAGGYDDTLLHWDGVAWSTVAVPTVGTIQAIWGSGPEDVYAAGSRLLHYDGATWAAVPTPPAAALRALWGAGPTDVFAAGSGGVLLHYDGTGWQRVTSTTTETIYGLTGTPRHLVAVGYAGFVAHLRRNAGWPCRAQETQCGDGVDDDCDNLVDEADPDCAGTQLLREIHGGIPDFVEIENNAQVTASLAGLSLAFRLSCDTTVQRHELPGDAILGPGQAYRVVDDPGDIGPRERYHGANICDNPGGGGWVALCAGRCDLRGCTNLLDYFEKTGTTTPQGAPLCASFTPAPLDVASLPATGASTESPTRTTRNGFGASGLRADWTLSSTSRE